MVGDLGDPGPRGGHHCAALLGDQARRHRGEQGRQDQNGVADRRDRAIHPSCPARLGALGGDGCRRGRHAGNGHRLRGAGDQAPPRCPDASGCGGREGGSPPASRTLRRARGWLRVTLGPDGEAAPSTIVGLLIASGQTVGTAESLTGGLVAAALTTVPGASAVFRGGIVAYAADLKSALLSVPADLIDRVGTVHRDVALAMASGAKTTLGATVGAATTGVAGPDPADGQPVGTVHIAVSTHERAVHEALLLSGDRPEIRRGAVDHLLNVLVRKVMEDIGLL